MMRSTLDYGHIISIADLRLVLAHISRGSIRWWIDDNVRFLRDKENHNSWLAVFHSNPGADRMTDELCFKVRVLPICALLAEEESDLVCLHPDLIEPYIEGLYLENGRVVGDIMEDWYMFWPPIRQALSLWQ